MTLKKITSGFYHYSKGGFSVEKLSGVWIIKSDCTCEVFGNTKTLSEASKICRYLYLERKNSYEY